MVIRVEKDKGNWGPNQMQIQILKLTGTIYSSLVFVRLLEIMWVWQKKRVYVWLSLFWSCGHKLIKALF